MKCLLETIIQEKEIANTRVKFPRIVKEIEADTSLKNLIMLTSIQRMNEYVTASRESNDNLFFEDKFAGDEQKKNSAEGDILRDIQEFWEAATSMLVATCEVTSAGVKTMLATILEATLATTTSMLAATCEVTYAGVKTMLATILEETLATTTSMLAATILKVVITTKQLQ